jgi:hypothetical protein
VPRDVELELMRLRVSRLVRRLGVCDDENERDAIQREIHLIMDNAERKLEAHLVAELEDQHRRASVLRPLAWASAVILSYGIWSSTLAYFRVPFAVTVVVSIVLGVAMILVLAWLSDAKANRSMD